MSGMAQSGRSKEYVLNSPDQSLQAIIRIDAAIQFDLLRNGNLLLSSQEIGLQIVDGPVLGIEPKVRKVKRTEVDQVIKPEIREKSESIRDHYLELIMLFRSGYSLEFRMFNEGLAYRLVLDQPDELVVKRELAGYRFGPLDSVCLALEDNFYSAYETP